MLAITTSDIQLLSRSRGLAFDSDPETSAILLNIDKKRGVSSLHFQVHISDHEDPEHATADRIDSLVIRGVASNAVRITSDREHRPLLSHSTEAQISKSLWIFYLHN